MFVIKISESALRLSIWRNADKNPDFDWKTGIVSLKRYAETKLKRVKRNASGRL
jgi:hypothetical protein